MTISPARISAFEILSRLEQNRGNSSELLAKLADDLSDRDRNLVHEIVLGSLRDQIHLDRLVDTASNQRKLDLAVQISLRMGLFQLLRLDRVPAYSAINESVELVARAGKSSAKPFVNAILRRASRKELVLKWSDDLDRLSVETSHPRWLLERWISEFGAAEAGEIAAVNNKRPRLAFRPTARSLTERSSNGIGPLAGYASSSYVSHCYFADSMTPELRTLESERLIYFQDEASQIVADAVVLKPGDRFLDVCASPGSKTTRIAAPGSNVTRAKLIVAGDLSDKRVKFLAGNCRRQGVDFVKCVRYDAEMPLPFSDASFDVVLVDAPCTGTGTIRHNPEIRYRIRESDFARAAVRQIAILRNASQAVKDGGMLVYSTCSLEIEENESVVKRFLDEDRRFTVVTPAVDERFRTLDGFARTLPTRDDMDGFFLAAMLKNADRRGPSGD